MSIIISKTNILIIFSYIISHELNYLILINILIVAEYNIIKINS